MITMGFQILALATNICPERLWMPRPSVEVLKARLDGALGSLGWSEMWRLVALPAAGEVGVS